MRASISLFLALLFGCLGSCGPKKKPGCAPSPSEGPPPAAAPAPARIEGRWLTPTGGSIEFKPGGRVTMAGPNGSRELAYMHTGNVIDIGAPGRPPAIHWVIVSLELQTLTIRDADGMEVKLQRAQE